MVELLTGQLAPQDLASDELQALTLLALAAAGCLTGLFVVLKKMSMLANALSHTVLIGIFAAYLLLFKWSAQPLMPTSVSMPVLLLASLITAWLTSALTQLLVHKVKLQEDASVGLVFTTLFALGILLVTLYTRNTHLGTEVIMGNIDAIHLEDLKVSLLMLGLTLAGILSFFKELTMVAFDPQLAASQGISPVKFSYLLILLTSAIAICAFRAVGVLLFLAFLVGPVIIARLFTHRMKPLLGVAFGLGSAASLIGVALSRHLLSVHGWALSTSGLVVALLGLLFFSGVLVQRCQRDFCFLKYRGRAS